MRKKGFFSELNLPVSNRYLNPPSRKWMIVIGGIIALLFLGFSLESFFLHGSDFISIGPLSSSHADLEKDCASCHTEFASVESQKCAVCHEQNRLPGIYDYEAHYFKYSSDSRKTITNENEKPCISCHMEHMGRPAVITEIPDARCQLCHDFGSVDGSHPQFEFARNQKPDNANLNFQHISHIREVRKREAMTELQETCFYCHEFGQGGKGFLSTNFERHCSDCHLAESSATPWLKVRDSHGGIGVETIDSMKSRHDPGLEWTYFANSAEFNRRGNRIRKSPVVHKDPWILENLKLIRQKMYRDSSLAALLNSSADVDQQNSQKLYNEAIQTLKRYSKGLLSRPEPAVMTELDQIEQLLKSTEKRLNDPGTQLDDSIFLLSNLKLNSDLTEDQANELTKFIDELAQPCLTCHLISKATLLRTQPNQGVFHSAEFDHSSHILQRKCLDCHSQIPLLEYIAADSIDYAVDNAVIQNIPSIENCQSCHKPDMTSNRCTTCHSFHPNEPGQFHLSSLKSGSF